MKIKALLIATLFMCGCSTSNLENNVVRPSMKHQVIEQTRSSLNVTDSLTTYTTIEDLEFLHQLGYDTTNVFIREDYYVVQSKYRFPKDYLTNIRSEVEQRSITQTDGEKLATEYQHLSIVLYATEASNAVYEAVDQWNQNLNCNLDFQIADNGIGYEHIVNFHIDDREQPDLLTTTPNIYKDGPVIDVFISTSHSLWRYMGDYGQTTNFMMHALGEMIGLADVNDFESRFYDRSIMLNENFITQDPNLWNGFSANDISTLESMYPIPTTEFSYEWSGSDSNSALICAVNSTISVTVEQTGGNSTDYTLEYTVDADESDYTVSEWGSSLNFQFLEAGTYTVTITPVAGEETFAGETFEIEVYDLPEMSYSWSPALQSENKVQIDEPYNLEIDGVGSQYDFTIEVEAETAGNECSCTEVNARAYQLVFDDPGVYNITLTVKIGTKTLITETLEIVAVDEPTFDFSWSPIPKNTKNKLLKGETYSLAISGLGNQYTVGLEVTPDTVEMEYDLTATSNRNFELVFNDTGKYNLAINVYNGERFAASKTIEVTAIEQPSINPTWTAASEIGTYYALSTDYTLNLNYVNDYYDNSNGFTYTFAVYLNDADTTSTVLKSKNGQQAVFNFNLPGEYRIVATVKRGSTVLETYETICPVVGGKIVRGNSPEVPTLDSPYTFTYHYWHPEHEEVSYEFKMSEELFDAGSSRNIYYQMESANSFMISFHDYGCYYIEATVKDGYEVCDKKIINFTKLYHPETCTFNALAVLPNMGYGEIRNYVKFNVQIGSGSTLPERFFGYIQKYKEIRRAFYITGERRVDREFTHTLLTIQREKESNALCNLPDGGFGISLNPSDPYEIYEGYTGYIHYPMDGVRLVPSKEIEILPKQQIRYDLNNLTEINF